MPAFVVKKTDHATYPPSATTAHSAAPQVEGSNPPSKSPEPATPLPLNKPEPRSPVPSPSVPIPALHPQGEGVEHPHPHPSPPRPRIPACPAGVSRYEVVGMYRPTPGFSGPPSLVFGPEATTGICGLICGGPGRMDSPALALSVLAPAVSPIACWLQFWNQLPQFCHQLFDQGLFCAQV